MSEPVPNPTPAEVAAEVLAACEMAVARGLDIQGVAWTRSAGATVTVRDMAALERAGSGSRAWRGHYPGGESLSVRVAPRVELFATRPLATAEPEVLP